MDVAERFLAARAANDIDSCVALVADDAVWHSPVGEPKLGRQGFREALGEAYEDTSWFATATLGVRPRGDVVVARVRNRGERDGDVLDSVQLLVVRVRDGAIADVRIYVDDPAAIAEFWGD
jgi:ketosteroid isomerase-like protein